jgi:hypothetical protein
MTEHICESTVHAVYCKHLECVKKLHRTGHQLHQQDLIRGWRCYAIDVPILKYYVENGIRPPENAMEKAGWVGNNEMLDYLGSLGFQVGVDDMVDAAKAGMLHSLMWMSARVAGPIPEKILSAAITYGKPRTVEWILKQNKGIQLDENSTLMFCGGVVTPDVLRVLLVHGLENIFPRTKDMKQFISYALYKLQDNQHKWSLDDHVFRDWLFSEPQVEKSSYVLLKHAIANKKEEIRQKTLLVSEFINPDVARYVMAQYF